MSFFASLLKEPLSFANGFCLGETWVGSGGFAFGRLAVYFVACDAATGEMEIWLKRSLGTAIGCCSVDPFSLISAQARRPAEFKHIIKRRKRN
jgi:hypothetical protein